MKLEISRSFIPRTLILSALTFSSVSLLAQSYPAGSPSSQTQPNSQQQSPNSTGAMQDSTASSGNVGQNMKDKMFLRKAAEGGMAEVKLGELATQKSSSDDVKTFAQKMVDDHTKLNNDMAPIAQSMGVKPPSKLSKADQAEYDKLSGLSGDAFDKEYLAYMVKDHHKDLREFREEASSTSDPTLKTAVTNGTQVIQEHTTMVDKLAQDKGLSVPQHGNKSTAAPTS